MWCQYNGIECENHVKWESTIEDPLEKSSILFSLCSSLLSSKFMWERELFCVHMHSLELSWSRGFLIVFPSGFLKQDLSLNLRLTYRPYSLSRIPLGFSYLYFPAMFTGLVTMLFFLHRCSEFKLRSSYFAHWAISPTPMKQNSTILLLIIPKQLVSHFIYTISSNLQNYDIIKHYTICPYRLAHFYFSLGVNWRPILRDHLSFFIIIDISLTKTHYRCKTQYYILYHLNTDPQKSLTWPL